ncbi:MULTISPECIES: NrsF family protein [Rhizobium]|jgi:hypothetical protein|uniref:DUF1109 family protein n=1 Tax=Rhizobium lusitanum TaxID=293958 RepID=A0A1C3WUU4_9HYPH|nr:NrsF family protein [Rhizobium lusitanum]SCB43730.1 hypothetical protein GA0061101_117125 [Rhizobium lusitanum]
MKTNDLIALLAHDAPVRINLSQALFHAAIAATIIAGAAFFGFIGFRVDIDTAVESVRFLFKFVITLALAITAGSLLLQIGRPGTSLGPWAWWLCLPVALVASAVALELLVMPSSTWEARMIGHNARLCLTIIPSLSAFPLACFLYAMRHGAPERPGVAGAVAGLVSAGIAATFYAANCNDDSPLFVMFWYPMAIAVVCAVGALFGQKMLKW